MTSHRCGLPSHHSQAAGRLLDFFFFFFHNNPAKSMRREGRPFKQEALQLTLTCYD